MRPKKGALSHSQPLGGTKRESPMPLFQESPGTFRGGCHTEQATVFAYKDCIDQLGNACRITWSENYRISYTSTFDPPLWTCDASGSTWISNTNIADPCQ